METLTKGPVMIDPNLYISAGIDPKTGLPLKAGSPNKQEPSLNTDLLKLFRVMDEQDAISRFDWVLPEEINGDLLERIEYYRGQGMFFYLEETGKFYFLPFTLAGEIDVYGRYKTVTPLPFNGVNKDEKDMPWLQGVDFDVLYEIPDDVNEKEYWKKHCVIISDYSKQISQVTIPRRTMNDPLLRIESQIIPFLRTALMNQTGTTGMRVNSDDEAFEVNLANQKILNAALKGDRYIPIRGTIAFQELALGKMGVSADFMQALESLENFRLASYGIDNGGLFQKKAHMLQDEQAQAGGAPALIMKNCLYQRTRACEIINAIFKPVLKGKTVSCKESKAQQTTEFIGEAGTISNRTYEFSGGGGSSDVND